MSARPPPDPARAWHTVACVRLAAAGVRTGHLHRRWTRMMKKLYGSHDPILLAQLREVLEANHIACIMRNDYLMGAAGELPPLECWPELWVLESWQHERARALIDAYLDAGNTDAAPWTCQGCGEQVEAPFSQCWRCGRERVADG